MNHSLCQPTGKTISNHQVRQISEEKENPAELPEGFYSAGLKSNVEAQPVLL